MFIKIYGARGSIPVSCKTSAKYGGNTTCLYVESSSGNSVIVDAGSGIRELGPYLIKNNKHDLHLIFTHYHWDHIQGFPFFGPFYFKDTVVNIYGPVGEVNPKKALSYQMARPFFPTIELTDLPSKFIFKKLKGKLKVGDLQIQTIINNHPNYTWGLKISEGKKSFAFMTDNELFAQRIKTQLSKFVKFIEGVDILIHDAQYTDDAYQTKIGWGHSTYSQVMRLAIDSHVKHVIFTHHDPFSSDQFIDGVVNDFSRDYPGYNIEAAIEGMEINLK